jgi:phosphoglycerate transport regulatory protein PgtC
MNTRRRALVRSMAAAVLAGAAPSMAAARSPTRLDVLTSYPDEVMSRFEAAFEKRHPEYRIRFLWRMPHDALPYLQGEGGKTTDVYWAASPRTFARLKESGLLRKLDADLRALPARLGATQLSDPDGYYVATELAGYALAIHDARLAALGVAAPRDWHELADPRLLDNIALPVPGDVGFAPVMYDIVLQAYGWQRGWRTWSEVAALARLARRGATFVTGQVGTGDVAIGLSIDFFVKAAIAGGAPLSQHYPQHNGVNPAHVALLAAGPNPAGAEAFARFVLSPQGQALLRHPDIARLPASPQAYGQAGFDPFAAAARGTMAYDGERGRGRLNVISAIFDVMLDRPHEEIRELWRQVHARENSGKPMAQVRELLSTPPLDEAAADGDAVQRLLGKPLEGGKVPADPGTAAMLAAWAERCAGNREAARRLLAAAGA